MPFDPIITDLVIGGSSFLAGVIITAQHGAKWASRAVKAEDERDDAKALNTKLQGLIDEIDATNALDLMAADNRARKQDDLIRKQGRELAEYRAKEQRRLAPLKAQAAKNHADKIARDAKSSALHASMQADIDATNAILNRSEAA